MRLPQQIQANGFSVGGNVPWSVAWTSEQIFNLKPSVDFPGLMDLVQTQSPGEGTPKFNQMHVTRHRAGMAQHMCHVCGKRTHRTDRYIFPVQSGAILPVANTTARYVGNVPPVHLACAKKAQALCPHLIDMAADPVAYPSEESTLVPRMDVVPGMEDLAKTLPRGMKIVYSCCRVFGPKFTRRVEILRGPG